MPVFEPGRLAESAYFLGHRGVCLYLISGKQGAVLIDSGMTPMAPLLKDQLKGVLDESLPLKLLLLTHSHFDHVGCAHCIRAWYPEVIVGAHPYVEDVFQNPRAVERIRELNTAGMEGDTLELLGIPPFSPVEIRKKLTGGEILSLGDREIHVVATPGHTRDSLSFFIPDLELLIPGEAMGVPDLKGRIIPEFLRSYPEYEESLKKLLELPVSILGLPHYGVLVGEEVRDYFSRVLSETQAFRDQILSALKKNGWEISRALTELDTTLYDPQAIAQPRKPFLINLEAMIRAVLNTYASGGMV